MKWLDWLFFMKDEPSDASGPSWNFRRKLIFAGYRLGALMVIFGMFTFFWDTQVSVQLVVGGVALISIILTAYTASATIEDVNLWKSGDDEDV